MTIFFFIFDQFFASSGSPAVKTTRPFSSGALGIVCRDDASGAAVVRVRGRRANGSAGHALTRDAEQVVVMAANCNPGREADHE